MKNCIVLAAVGLLFFVSCDDNASRQSSQPDAQPVATATHADSMEAISIMGGTIAQHAIAEASGHPELLKFESKTMEQYYPGTGMYVCKWVVGADNVDIKAYGIASVHYKGGEITDEHNWEVVNAKVEDE